jgi:hypothetical protein
VRMHSDGCWEDTCHYQWWGGKCWDNSTTSNQALQRVDAAAWACWAKAMGGKGKRATYVSQQVPHTLIEASAWTCIQHPAPTALQKTLPWCRKRLV